MSPLILTSSFEKHVDIIFSKHRRLYAVSQRCLRNGENYLFRKLMFSQVDDFIGRFKMSV